MAAVRARSSQKRRRASGLAAMNPSPFRAWVRRTTSGRGGVHQGGIVRHQVREQDHLGQLPAGRLGGIAHGADIALVQVLQAGDLHPRQAVHMSP